MILFELANKSERTVRGGVVKFHIHSATIVNSTYPTFHIFIGQIIQNPSESFQIYTDKLSTFNQKLY